MSWAAGRRSSCDSLLLVWKVWIVLQVPSAWEGRRIKSSDCLRSEGNSTGSSTGSSGIFSFSSDGCRFWISSLEILWYWRRLPTLREWQYQTSPITEIMKMKPQTRPVTSAFWIFSSSKDFSFFSSRLKHKVRNQKFQSFHIINISLFDTIIGRTKLSRTTVFVISTENNKDLTWITPSFVFNPLFIQARHAALPQLHKN